jgi:glycosyltransferase involved in cell wall biosynthesis
VNHRIVVSGVNLTEMGPLAVFKDALNSLAAHCSGKYQIIALVHNCSLFDTPGIEFIEFPAIKASWLRRVYFEFWQCRAISAQIKPLIWLSMDNVTPSVVTEKQVVYCHNPSPFYRFRFRDLWLDWKFGLFTLFFRYLYSINIERNDCVVVQQHWIRQSFERMYRVKNVIVAHPNIEIDALTFGSSKRHSDNVYRFFYPAFPRPFKNAEIALSAALLLEESGFHDFELWLTFDANVNRYACSIAKRFSHVRSVRWLGLLSREQVLTRYADANCLLFPSKLETWGLPITEFQMTGKPILAADLPYAHETVGNYNQAAFFDPNNPVQLAQLMRAAASGQPVFSAVSAKDIPSPFALNWPDLWRLLLPSPQPTPHPEQNTFQPDS